MNSSAGLLAMPDDALQLIFDALAKGSGLKPMVLARESGGNPLSQTCRCLCDFYRLKYVNALDAATESDRLLLTEEAVADALRLLQRYPLVRDVSMFAGFWQELTSADVKSHNVDLERVTKLNLERAPEEVDGELELAGDGVGDSILLPLFRLVPALRYLSVSLSNSASVSGLSAVSLLASLESLELGGWRKDGTCLVTAVSAVPCLRRLVLVSCKVNAELFSRLPRGLNDLEVVFCVTGPDQRLIDLNSLLRSVHSLSGLRRLRVEEASSHSTDFSHLSKVAAGLTSLKLWMCDCLLAGRMDDRNIFATFSSMHSLTSLSLKFSECMYDDVLRAAANLASLEFLFLSSLLEIETFGGVVCTERVISRGGLVALSKRPARHSLRQALFTFLCQAFSRDIVELLRAVLETSRSDIFGSEVFANGADIDFIVQKIDEP